MKERRPASTAMSARPAGIEEKPRLKSLIGSETLVGRPDGREWNIGPQNDKRKTGLERVTIPYGPTRCGASGRPCRALVLTKKQVPHQAAGHEGQKARQD